MKYLFLLLIGSSSYGVNCKKHPIYCHIKKIAPHTSDKWAMKISNLIYSGAKRAKISPMISVAIARQESAFINTTVEVVNIRKETICHTPDHCITNTKTKHLIDIGLFQINANTAGEYGCDKNKLMRDVEYNVACHFKILVDKMRICRKLNIFKETWSCYHSITRRFRVKYAKAVRRFLPKTLRSF